MNRSKLHAVWGIIPSRTSNCEDLDTGVCDRGERELEMRLERKPKAASVGLKSSLSTVGFTLSVLGSLWRVPKSGII